MCSRVLVLVVTFILFAGVGVPRTGHAGPGDYSLRLKGGPSFNLHDWQNQVRFGAEFDYELGYSLGIGLLTLFGVSDDFRFQLTPTLRYDVIYIGPAAFYTALGAGYGVFNRKNAFDVRVATGVILPLGDKFEVNSDVNLFITPAGTPGTPMTLDWLLAFGFRFH